MSTSYYVYHIPSNSYQDWRRSLEQCLKRKEFVGVITGQRINNKLSSVFTWAMHPGAFLNQVYFYGEFYAIVDEYGNKMMLAKFFTMLRDSVVRLNYDKDNIPA